MLHGGAVGGASREVEFRCGRTARSLLQPPLLWLGGMLCVLAKEPRSGSEI